MQPRDSHEQWIAARIKLLEAPLDNRDLMSMMYDILGPLYVYEKRSCPLHLERKCGNIVCLFSLDAFQAPCNILKSGDLEENQYNAEFVNVILKNTLKVICSVDWR